MSGNFFVYAPHLFYLIFVTYLFCILIVISVYDYHHQVIPDKLVWIFNSLAFVGVFLFVGSTYMLHVPQIGMLLAGPIVAVPFLLLWILTGGRGMGFGDVKLALGMGWLLGLGSGLAAVLVSFWIGGLVGLCILLFRKNKYTLKSRIAFGPFMCVATFFVYLFGVTIIDILMISF
jgi:prepilin signal peptidase PulO-like enzyme (type II secretory pathway)